MNSDASTVSRPVPAFQPTLSDLRQAAATISRHISIPTPLVHSPGLSDRLDAHVSLKLETGTPISSFKIRGGIHLLEQMPAAQRAVGLVTASTGNHGQSIAYAAGLYGVRARVIVPVEANPDKVAAIERLGAEVVRFGDRFDDSRMEAERLAKAHGYRYVHSSDEPDLMAGVGTAGLEVLESQAPETEIVIVPLGGGSGTCGWIAARDGLGHGAEIWATQSAQSPAAHDAWRSGERAERPNTTFAEGLATAVPFAMPFEILRNGLDDFILVADDEIAEAVRTLIDSAHVLAEPAGASSTAAAYHVADRIRGRRVVLVVSGANATREQLRALL